MAKTFRLPKEVPLLDIVAHGGGGTQESARRLTPEQVEHIRRTVQRVPEVMVKVLSRASNDLKAAGKHLDYISRHGAVELETDHGELLTEKRGAILMEDWDLDIDDVRRQAKLAGTNGKSPPKLVHKLMFSMPAGTPPNKVLAAVRNFAREEFWGQHRYAFALHTDEDHPHVHLVLKAVSEQGMRLNIRKVTLRHWRSEFARHLRTLDVPANATERAVRGQVKKAKKDGIYRANLRGESTHTRIGVEAAASLLARNNRFPSAPEALLNTRNQIVAAWNSIARQLAVRGVHDLAINVRHFVDRLPPAQAEQALLIAELIKRVQETRESSRLVSSREHV